MDSLELTNRLSDAMTSGVLEDITSADQAYLEGRTIG